MKVVMEKSTLRKEEVEAEHNSQPCFTGKRGITEWKKFMGQLILELHRKIC